MKSLSIQVNKDEYNKDKKFSPKITSPVPELIDTQDGNVGLHLQVPRGGTHLNGVGSELTIYIYILLSFCYSWFRLQMIAIHCDRRGCTQEHLARHWLTGSKPRCAGCGQNTLTQDFLDTFIFVHTSHCGSRCRTTCLISRLLGCAGQAADAVSACTQVKMEDAPKLLKIPKSECPDIWIRLPRHTMAQIMVQYGRSSSSS